MEQYIIVGIIVALSALYILRRFVFRPKSGGGSSCGCGCDGCSRKNKGCH